jgi:IS5 family transposase
MKNEKIDELVELSQNIKDHQEKQSTNKKKIIDTDARRIKDKGKKSIYGYKLHAAVNTLGFFSDVITTPANVHDGHMLASHLENLALAKETPVYTDKNYYSHDNDKLLYSKFLRNFIMRQVDSVKNPNRMIVICNKLISKVRYVVERSFGGMKTLTNHRRTRYIGIEKVHNQNLLVCTAFNMVRVTRTLQERCVPI